jgi:4-carboxymuconolactone decarboxylase
MARLAKLSAEDLDDDQKQLYEAITGGPRSSGRPAFPLVDHAGALEGPFNAMLLQPALGSALQSLGAAIRYQGTLPGRTRELAILVVAAAWRSEFEQYAHEAVGLHEGLRAEDLAAIRAGQEPDLTDPAERAAVRTAWALARRGDLDDAEYADAVAQLGEPALFELTTLVGYYATLALQLRAFRVGSPAE